jgi:cold-inducible RNA-binding protein
MRTKLYVGNRPFERTEADLQSLFAQAGTVETVIVVRDRDTGRARGGALVEKANASDAQSAINQLNEKPIGGRNLTVNEARPQTPRSGGGFGGNRGGRRSEPRW